MLLSYLLLFFLIFGVCKSVWFNVSRGAPNETDLFSNLDPSATCPGTNGRTWCGSRNGQCSNRGCCICVCKYDSSTFRIESKNVTAASCMGNIAIRKFAGCTQYRFQSVGQNNPLVTLDLSKKDSKGIEISGLSNKAKCRVKDAEYLDQQDWENLSSKEEKTFSMSTHSSWPHYMLEWTGTLPSSYFGRVMRVDAECRHGRDKKKFCVVFRTKGILTYDVQIPTNKPVTTSLPSTTKFVSTTASTTASTMASTTASTTVSTTVKTKKVTTQVSSTKNSSKGTTQKSTSRKETTSASTKLTTTRTTLQTTEMTSKPSNNGSHTGGESSTESTQTTKQLTGSTGELSTNTRPNNAGSQAPNKDESKASTGGKIDDTMIIIAVCVAAAISVAVILLCLWLVCQRRRRKNAANYGSGSTVLANPTTNTQNHLPMPGLLKNPMFEDPMYTEPQERVNMSALSLIGNGACSARPGLLLENPGANDDRTSSASIPLNNLHPHKKNTHAKENIYDNARRKSSSGGETEEEKSLYQSLVGQEESAHFSPPMSVPTYQSLNPDELMYQPLRKNNAHKSHDAGPEYLTLLNPTEERGSRTTPSPPVYQPPYSTGPPPMDIDEAPEYADYADLDELEQMPTSKETSAHGPCHPAPVYDVLEGPYSDSYRPPVYDVLEGRDSNTAVSPGSRQQAPVYDVLEGPDSSYGNVYLELQNVN